MTIAILSFLIFTIVLLILKIENKLTFVFGLGFISIMILMLTLVFYTIRISNFHYFFRFEFFVIKYLGKIPISYHDIKYLMSIGITAFLAVMLYFFIGDASKNLNIKKNLKYISAFIIFSLFFIYFNSTPCAETIYLNIQYAENDRKVWIFNNLQKLIVVYNVIYIIMACVLPYCRIFREYKTTRLFYTKRYLISLAFAVLILQTLFLFVIFATPLRHYIINSSLYDIFTVTKMYTREIDYYLLIITLSLLTVLAFIFIKSYLLKDDDFLKTNRNQKKKIRFIMKDVRHIFHTLKNLMALILVLVDKAIETNGTDESIESMIEIKDNVATFFNKIKKFLDIHNQPEFTFDNIQLLDCVSSAAAKVKKIYGINAEIRVDCEDTAVWGCAQDFTEVFLNLISNSAEAISSDGKIVIKMWSEDKWVCVSVWDNGVGIERKLIGNLFKPFCSSKKNFNNWGIGLSYVKKVVEAYFGFVCVKSVLGKYTEFQVILPMAK